MQKMSSKDHKFGDESSQRSSLAGNYGMGYVTDHFFGVASESPESTNMVGCHVL